MHKNIEVIALVYKSVDYLRFIEDQLRLAKADGWQVGVRIIANDPTDEVREALEDCTIPYSIYKDKEPQDFYLNRVYRCWNYAGASSRFDSICFVNSDMMFSYGWLDALLKHHDGTNIPCSRLVESGKLRSGTYGIEQNFGTHPNNLDAIAFESFTERTKEDKTQDGGLFMPCIFETKRFIDSGGYPEGNLFSNDGKLYVGFPNDRPVFMSGDQYFFANLAMKLHMKHITVFDSIVYHIQEGEMDE